MNDRTQQAIVRHKGQTTEAAATAGLQCETNHIFVAMNPLAWQLQCPTKSRRARSWRPVHLRHQPLAGTPLRCDQSSR